MKTLQGSILQVAVVLALATCLALTSSCKNGGNTDSSTDTLSTMNADTIRADSSAAPLPKKTRGIVRVNEPAPAPAGEIVEDKDHVYNHAEVEPAFPGGESALNDYVNDNINYPQKALDREVGGKVSVQFIVDDQGNVSHVTTLGEPIGYGLEEEAIRVVSNSPKWTPGKVKGKNVKTYMMLPIIFTME